MIRVMKYLTEHLATVLLIIVLLVIQAMCDLALPQYTSNIVDIGIQQGGIEDNIPDVIRESSMDNIKLFLTEDEQETFIKAYSVIRIEDLSDKKSKEYNKKYPGINSNILYEYTGDDKISEELKTILRKPMMMVTFLTTESDELTKIKEDTIASMGMQGVSAEDIDMLEVLKQIPALQREEMFKDSSSKYEEVPDLILNQMAISFVKEEYKAIGIDLSDLQYNYLMNIGVKMIAIALFAMIVTVIVCLLAAQVAAKIGMNLRSRVFSKVVSFSGTEMDRFSTASLITRSTNDIQQVQMVAVMLLRMVFYAPILGIGGVFKVLHTNTSMAWIIFATVALIMFIVGILFIVAMPKFRKVPVLVDRINLVTREILTGLPVIRAFSTESHEEERFDIANKDLTKNLMFTNRTMAFMMPIMMFIMNGVTLVIIWFGAKGIDLGNLQVGDMMAFMTYTFQIVFSFLMLTIISIMLPRAAVSAARIDEVLHTDLAIMDPKTGENKQADGRGFIEFSNVHFRYPNAEDDALEGITFTARPGQTTAFIGSTGSGKTTLINLIPRLYDVTKGSVTIDGVDVRDMSQHDLRELLGYVPQKGVLFSGDIESNIRYGYNDASEEDIKKAAAIAQASDFIEEKPEGYKSTIAQGGTNVSGGQKQRLSIARAIAKRPRIYIFDDSFSALDYKTDVTLRKALKEEMSESTVLIVAQRVSTIMHADQIIVLDEGKIAGIGTHSELLKTNEVYQQIASSQLSSEELKKHSNNSKGGK